MNTYKAFYLSQTCTVHATTSYAAQTYAARVLRGPAVRALDREPLI